MNQDHETATAKRAPQPSEAAARRTSTVEPSKNETNGTSSKRIERHQAKAQSRIRTKRQSSMRLGLRDSVRERSIKLTLALLSLFGAICSLTPYLSLHLTNRIGLLLFESEIVQVRSSLVSMILCTIVLVGLGLFMILRESFFSKWSPNETFGSGHFIRASLSIQRTLRLWSGLMASLSVLAYLALALIVPHIKQVQRMPLATFDCQANEIAIENCQQQFPPGGRHFGRGDDLLRPLAQMFAGDLNGNHERLIRKFDCLRFNDRDLSALRRPTRFLLHKCGLVCKPHRQQLHQFSDDLNSEKQAPTQQPLDTKNNNDNNNNQGRRLAAPYSHESSAQATRSRPETGHQFPSVLSVEDRQGTASEAPTSSGSSSNLVTLKICFSGEVDGAESALGSSNYKRFCIENLTSEGQSKMGARSASSEPRPAEQLNSVDQDTSAPDPPHMTVGQLNAILALVTSGRSEQAEMRLDGGPVAGEASIEGRDFPARKVHQQQLPQELLSSTHYVNPIVQFESHFKNWPHLKNRPSEAREDGSRFSTPSSSSTSGAEHNHEAWCKFRPIPPFIVNNKPFSDIQCSLEHEYLIRNAPNSYDGKTIYLRRSSAATLEQQGQEASGATTAGTRERCSIQCKMNVLYQVAFEDDESRLSSQSSKRRLRARSFYLPMKPCLFQLGSSHKQTTAGYYLLFRSLADASLFLTFILFDLLLLMESVDTQQFYLETKRARLLGLLLALALLPIFVALLFDRAAAWPSGATGHQRHSEQESPEGPLLTFLNQRLIPTISDALSSLHGLISTFSPNPARNAQQGQPSSSTLGSDTSTTSAGFANYTNEREHQWQSSSRSMVVVDSYLVPFFIYALLMFTFVLSVLKMPAVATGASSLERVASTEHLGLTPAKSPLKSARSLGRELDKLSQKERNKAKSLMASSLPNVAEAMPLRRSEEETGNQDKSGQRDAPNNDSQLARAKPRRLVAFAVLILFMGMQFNLSQNIQTQILLDSFDLKAGLRQQDSRSLPSSGGGGGGAGAGAAFWFAMTTHSGGGLVLFLLGLLFSEELSAFLADFSPFKLTKSLPVYEREQAPAVQIGPWDAKFRLFLSVSLLIYAIRYFALANLVNNNLRWPLVLLFQVLELLNFPLTWLVLTGKAHEMANQWLSASGHRASAAGSPMRDGDASEAGRCLVSRLPSGATLLGVHLAVQATLALIYLVLSRLLALFVHTLHANLHLHSDNIDWFIGAYYSSMPLKHNASVVPQGSQTNSSQADEPGPLGPLFSPLPSERQTYLHSSRLFIKYNSLICFVFGSILLASFLFTKYKIWIEKTRRISAERKACEKHKAAREAAVAAEVDDQLTLDLAQIKTNQLRESMKKRSQQMKPPPLTSMSHVPIRSIAASARKAQQQDSSAEEGPRARIHFRYDLARRRRQPRQRPTSTDDSSSSSSSFCPSSSPVNAHKSEALFGPSRQIHSSSTLPPPAEFDEDSEPFQKEEPTGHQIELNIPILLERRKIGRERVVTRRTLSRRVQLVEDGEDWSLGDGDLSLHDEHRVQRASPQLHETAAGLMSPPPPEFADGFGGRHEGVLRRSPPSPPSMTSASAEDSKQRRHYHRQQHQAMAKRISFAPMPTLIDHDGGAGRNANEERARRAATSRAESGEKSNASATASSSEGSFARRASPEPSIDGLHDDEDDDEDEDGDQVTVVTRPKLQLGEADSIDNY